MLESFGIDVKVVRIVSVVMLAPEVIEIGRLTVSTFVVVVGFDDV